jgi:aspartate dehydrogenase
MIGYGAIGRALGAALRRLGEARRVAGVLVREGRDAGPFPAVHSADALIAAGADVVLECAGHAAVLQYGPSLLSTGIDVVITSVGALAEPSAMRDLRSGPGRLLMAAGAVGGLDALLAARLAGLERVTYVSTKPPLAWRGTVADRFDLSDAGAEQVLFEGSAREAARLYPRNANVAVAVALCGLGLDKTQARLVSSPKVSDPLGVIEAEGACGRFRFEAYAYAAADNPKTSVLTAYSLLQCARLGLGLPVFELWSESEAAPFERRAE